jgi:hypothetical protein
MRIITESCYFGAKASEQELAQEFVQKVGTLSSLQRKLEMLQQLRARSSTAFHDRVIGFNVTPTFAIADQKLNDWT